jgi:TetR/AcrR family transcriptional regulator, cholesterol catabolism regulator
MRQTNPKPVPRAPQSVQRSRILENSARLFAHQGFEGTSINEIADEVNLSKATIYHYFSGKEDIYTEIILDTLDRLLVSVREAIERKDTAALRLVAVMEAHAQFFEDNFWAFTAMLIGFGGIRELNRRARAVALRDTYEALFRDTIAAGVASGEFRPVDPAIASRAVLSVLNWMVRWYKPGGAKRAREFAQEYAALIMQGLCSPLAARGPELFPNQPNLRS